MPQRMTWPRLFPRNRLAEPFTPGPHPDPTYTLRRQMATDLAQLQRDTLLERTLATYAEQAAVTPEQARAVLQAFFDGVVLGVDDPYEAVRATLRQVRQTIEHKES